MRAPRWRLAGCTSVPKAAGFYALNETTAAVVWSRQLDTEPKGTCSALGISSTAAVTADPVTRLPTVYVSGARYTYALNAATGAVVWKTRIGPPATANPDAYYNWSSPTGPAATSTWACRPAVTPR